MKKNTIVLAILDGWGVTSKGPGNAVELANMEYVKYLKSNYPNNEIEASGPAVGLPMNQMGNSEVGHLHIGAGRIHLESLCKINNDVENNKLGKNKALNEAIDYCKKHNSAFHLMGLFSDGGVHSHMDHMIAAYKYLVKQNLKAIYFHLIGDGRDTQPKVFLTYLTKLQDIIKRYSGGVIASISGRYYTMDRDKRFERTNLSFETIVNHHGDQFLDPYQYVQSQYNEDISDEFLKPAYNANLKEDSKIKGFDVLFFTNFRPDRAIQFTAGLSNLDYLWQPQPFLKNLYLLTMTSYSPLVKPNNICYPKQILKNTLGSWLSQKGYHQLRIAETEKIAHVTFFFDGKADYFQNGLAKQKEITLKKAAICLIPSPKVATYDLQPKMSAHEITDRLVEYLDQDLFDFVVLNFANGDMVGHTGFLKPAIIANQVLDNCLKRIHQKLLKKEGTLVITSDHGNCEEMIDIKNGGPNKKHTTNLVPFIITKKGITLRKHGMLSDVAPTILDLFDEDTPLEMTNKSLIIK